jgi:hypothetical protein
MDKKPNFFIIGAPKCGTTALSEYLRSHPNIFFSTPKEPGFFGQDYPLRTRAIKSTQKYLNLFKKVSPTHIAIGEGSTRYFFSKSAIKEILAFNPCAKFIVMLRNPIDMFLSLYNHFSSHHVETAKTPEKAWRLQATRKGNVELSYNDQCKLGVLVERLFNQVPRQTVKIIFYDDFSANTLKTYKEVLEFLNVPYDQKTYFPRINPHKVLKNHKLNLFFRSLYAIFRFRHKLKLSWISCRKFSNKIEKTNLRSCYTTGPRVLPSATFIRELKNHFKEDVLKLSRLTNRDLTHWIS